MITENKRKRLERNARIRVRYNSEMSVKGNMKSIVIAGIAKSYRMTVPTVYSILKDNEKPEVGVIEITNTHKDEVFATIDGKQYRFDIGQSDVQEQILKAYRFEDWEELTGMTYSDHGRHALLEHLTEERAERYIIAYIQEIIEDGELSEWEVTND